MKPELRKKILAHNKEVAEKKEKANDLDIIIAQMMKLPKGQLKKLLNNEVIAVLEKHGVSFKEE